jgi:hypothetical protein
MNDTSNLAEVLQSLATTLVEVATQLKATTMPSAPCNASGMMVVQSPRLATPWPRIERNDFGFARQIGVTHPLFQKNFASGQTVALYAAGCSALSQLAARTQLPLFKLGTSLQPDLLIRQEELRIDRYGSAIKTKSGYTDDRGWDDWEMRQLQAALTLSSFSPVHYTPRALLISLPASYSARQFEKDLQAIVEPISLTAWSATPVGGRHFATLGIELSEVQRYTGYKFGTRDRYMRAREIYICRPRTDLVDIAARIEDLIVAHVLVQSGAITAAA